MTVRDLKYGALFCLAAVILFFGESLLTGSSYFAGDLTYYWWPRKHFIANQLQNGLFPLWDPTFRCGIPFFAIPDTGVLDLFSLVFNFFSFGPGLKIFHLFSFFTAALFCFLAAKSRKISNSGALFAAAMIVFGGYFIARSQFLSQCSTLTWGACLGALLLSGQLLACALPLSLMVFAGHWQLSAILLLFLTPVIVALIRNAPPRTILRLLTAASAAAAIGAVQILPSVELSKLSYWGAQGVEYAQAAVFALQSKDLINLLIPVQDAAQGLDNPTWINSIYLGIVPCVLALWTFKDLPVRLKVVCAVVGVFSIAMSLGDSTPLLPFLFERAPFLSYLRYPSRWILGAILLLSALAAAGFEKSRGRWKITLLCLSLLPMAWNWWGSLPVVAQNYFHDGNVLADELMNRLSDNRRFFFNFQTERLLTGTGDDRYRQALDLRDRLYIRTPLPYRLHQAGGFGEPLVPMRMDSALDYIHALPAPEAAAPMLSRLGVSTLLMSAPRQSTSFTPGETVKWTLYENPAALPRAYWIRPEHFQDTQAWDTARTGFERVSQRYLDQKIAISGAAPEGNGWIVLSDAYYPGWESYVNGRESKIYPDAELFRAVQVPEAFDVTFIYRPLSFFLGLIISAAACFAAGWLFYRRIKI